MDLEPYSKRKFAPPVEERKAEIARRGVRDEVQIVTIGMIWDTQGLPLSRRDCPKIAQRFNVGDANSTLHKSRRDG
jgi:hypothetical protein